MFEVFKLAPLDKRAKLTTVITFIGAGIFTLGFIYLFPFLFAPRKYLLSPKGIKIRSLIATDFIERNNISSLEILGPIKHGAGINTCTSDFFGYSGEYALADGSVARVYATSWERMVKITACKGDPYLLSPLEPESFVQAVKQCYLNTGEKVVFMGIVISSGLRYQEYLKSVVAGSQYNPYPHLVFSSFFFIFAGLLIALPRFLFRVREEGHWKFDWVKFLSIGLPTFYACTAPLGYFVISDTIWPSALSNLLFANGTLHVISGVVCGYVILTSFDKKQVSIYI